MAVVPAILAFVSLTIQVPPLSEREVDRFVRDLRNELARNDRAAVAARVRYPIVVFAGGVRIPIADARTMVDSFALVFTPAFVAQLGRGAPIVSGDAATAGGTVLEIRRVDNALRITRIMVPLGDVAVQPPSPSTAATRGGPLDRLGIDIGRAQRSAALAPGEHASYVLFAPKNRLLDVRIEGVHDRDIVARIVRAKDGAPVDERAQQGTRTWTGRVPEDGDYTIEVVRLARDPAEPLPFTLIVSMR